MVTFGYSTLVYSTHCTVRYRKTKLPVYTLDVLRYFLGASNSCTSNTFNKSMKTTATCILPPPLTTVTHENNYAPAFHPHPPYKA